MPRSIVVGLAVAITALLTAAVSMATSARAAAAAGFYAGGRWRSLALENGFVAVRRQAPMAMRSVSNWPARALAGLAQIGLAVVKAEDIADLPGAEADVVGVPVWFNRESSALGILTPEIVVGISGQEGRDALMGTVGLTVQRPSAFAADVVMARFATPAAAMEAANNLYRSPGIRFAHPNFIMPKSFRGNGFAPARQPQDEPYFGSQWHLRNLGQFGGLPGADIHVLDAWAMTTGVPGTIVAVLDSGFDAAHPDLAAAWWRNLGEIPANGIDDDGNGFVDDVQGWNFSQHNADITAGTLKDHGTAVAGLVGARVNGLGVTGVCPGCTVLPVVVAWTPVDDAAAFYYSANAGAAVISCSWGYEFGTPIPDVVREATATVAAKGRHGKGIPILFAMNNFNEDDCGGSTPDISSLPAVIAISASNQRDEKIAFTAWGECLKFLAPSRDEQGPGIATTDLPGAAGYNDGRVAGDFVDLAFTNQFGGTSAATPIAAGVFGLMLSMNPNLSRDSAVTAAVMSADKVHPELASYAGTPAFSNHYGYGRINAAAAVAAARGLRP